MKMGLFSFLLGKRKSEERLRDSLERVAILYRHIISSEHHVVYDLRKAHNLIQRERELRNRIRSLDKLKNAKGVGEEARSILREERRVIREMEHYANNALNKIRLQRSKIRAIRRYL